MRLSQVQKQYQRSRMLFDEDLDENAGLRNNCKSI